MTHHPSAGFLLTTFAFVFLTGCATIVHGSQQEVRVTSTPDQATVYVDGEEAGRTPTVVRLDRDARHGVELRLEGYAPWRLQVQRQASPWAIIGGVLFFPGVVVDWATGSLYELEPGHVHGNLERANDEGRSANGK